ncbi:MAG TPA: hypothetical protein VJS92_10975, partial [Candidatus Polarisedimenticolaceae bacterium]|nr:hypothetical protein [Candidatus Polarisedimenticolaceae bacterium]
NAAWRALDQGEVAGVAPRVEQARRVMPDLGKRNDGLRDLLGAAFVRAYEGARFDDAYALAALETSLFPTFTTPRDRLLAAASKRVETICERGEPAAAAAVLEAAAATSSQPSDLVRLERAVTPIIVAAAVVAEDWPLAQRMAERFAGAEPDRVQGARLIAWVQTRRGVDPVPRADPACPDPLARAAFPPLTSRP